MTYQSCGWIKNLPLRNSVQSINKNFNCDWIVIGAGYTGLSAARKLGELHLNSKIVLIEKEEDIKRLKAKGFFEEIVTLVMTLKKYPINLSNIQVDYDGESMKVAHFETNFFLGSPSDLGRKAAVLGYYVSEEPCVGDVRLVYSEDGKEIRAVTNCK